MSYGTRKAIAGTMAGTKAAAEGAAEFIRRMDEARSAEDVAAVLAWAKARGGWFLRSRQDDLQMRAAWASAKARVAARLCPVCPTPNYMRRIPVKGYECPRCGRIEP